MPDTEDIPHIDVEDERKARTLQRVPTMPTVVKDHTVTPISDADRILGLTPEYSGWDVYNNEARKVDMELVYVAL